METRSERAARDQLKLDPSLDHALEWNRFLGLSQAEARTECGKILLHSLADPNSWAKDVSSARLLQQDTQEASQILDRDALWGPLTDLRDPFSTLERLERGSVLEILDLALLRGWIYAIDSWVQTPREEIRNERFKKALLSLSDPRRPLQILDRLLTPEGDLSEKASPKLSSLHTEIRALKREVGITLDQLLKTFSQKGILQENFTDVRDGRFVLPIKISSQGDVDGIIYEASASRQTVFVEPKEVAPLNNRLKQRQNELIQEVFEVLQEASKNLQPFALEISSAVNVLSYWDSIQARARLGRHYAGKPIQVAEERIFQLHETAHPLLWWSLQPQQIVRNEIDFGDPIKTLLLTGPNTGGKTVLLKTLGLAGICARTGFPFPATDRPIVPFFDSFFADLGDPQSIEQHLSSFSGHVLRFKKILEQVTDRSLVLIDELNSATDPEEGSALGRSVLETIMTRGALIVTTTHDPYLKASAVSDKRILNASMQFDESSRSPTYRMVLGVPGRSRALETAERLGLSKEVLDLARNYLTREHIEFEKVLSKLESDTQIAAQARKEAVTLRDQAESLRKEWFQKTESNVGDLLDRTRQKLRRILEQAQDEVRATVRKLDEMRSRRELDHTRSQLNQTLSTASSQLESALKEEAPEIADNLNQESARSKEETPRPRIEAGISVRIPKWKNTGVVLELQSEGSKVKVAMGTLQMVLPIGDVEVIPPSPGNKNPSHTQVGGTSSEYTPPSQLDLRGVRLDEAMSQLEHYLDQAFRSGGLAQVTIVHGLGTGALREGARKILKNLPYVKEYRDGGAGHGGTGATIVEFDRD